MLWNSLLFLISISILITVHEFGHFIISRWCGVRVECFSIGFGKKIFSYTSSKGTEYKLAMIPLGGYVKMLDGRAVKLTESEKPFAFNHKTILQRAAIIVAGPVANFLLALVLYWVIFLLGVVSYPVAIAQTLPNSPAASINIPSGSELNAIAGIKIESWSDVSSALISEMGKDSIAISYIDKNNNTHNANINIKDWRFDIEKTSPITAFGFVPAKVEIYPVIDKLISGSAAEKNGLQVGDEIVRYNNKLYDDWQSLAETISQGQPIELAVKRANQTLLFTIQPDITVDELGNKNGKLGFYPTSNAIVKQYGIVSAILKSAQQTGLTIKLTVRSIYQLLTGVISIKNLSGPVSIAQGAGQTASYGVVPYLYFLAFISISLGIINLVPLPMLDGGHLIFLLVEKLQGRPVSDKTQEVCYRLGFVLLMVIMAIALFNDFVRLLL